MIDMRSFVSLSVFVYKCENNMHIREYTAIFSCVIIYTTHIVLSRR